MKVCVSDVDGTIVNSYGDLSQETIDTLINFQKKGNLLVLASGRSYLRMMPIAQKLEMDKYNGILIDVNGVSIFDFKSKKRKRFYKVDESDLSYIFNELKPYESEIKFYSDDAIFTWLPESIYDLKLKIRKEMKLPDDYPWTSGEYGLFSDMRNGYPYQKLIKNIVEIDRVVNKVALCNDNETLLKLKENFSNSKLSEYYDAIFSSKRQLDIISKDISKGKAVSKILNDFKKEDIYIFGDSENDLSMLSLSDNAYLMENADNLLHNLGFKIAKSNDNNGVASVIKKII